MNEHWLCPECDVFDGPISDGNCDVCLHDGNLDQRVVRLVPVPDEQAIERAESHVENILRPYSSVLSPEILAEQIVAATLVDALEQPE
jgi:hypothetical protein